VPILPNKNPLTQEDYEDMVLQAVVELTNDSNENFEFSVSQIAKNLKQGNSKNRTIFAIRALLDANLIGDAGSSYGVEVEEPNFAQIVKDDEPRFYITKSGLDTFDEQMALDVKIRGFMVSEVSHHMRLLAFIYANTRSALDFFCRLSPEKLSTDKMAVLAELSQLGLVKTFFFKDGWTVTEEGRQFLESEAKAKSISLDDYIREIDEMTLNEVFDADKIVA
jgi:hypothetical protein